MNSVERWPCVLIGRPHAQITQNRLQDRLGGQKGTIEKHFQQTDTCFNIFVTRLNIKEIATKKMRRFILASFTQPLGIDRRCDRLSTLHAAH